MLELQKKIVTDESLKPIAVQINYADWLKIEDLLNLKQKVSKTVDLSSYSGSIKLTEDPLEYQKRIRSEWK